jgi:hypothetical protein
VHNAGAFIIAKGVDVVAEKKSGRAATLTNRQRKFVDEYLIDLNATQAAIRAGYSKKTADRIGPELLGKIRSGLESAG